MKERALKFLKLIQGKKPKTYQQIGDMFGVSKTLVYLELKKYFPEETKEAMAKNGWHKGNRKTQEDFKEFTCKNCGITKQSEYRYRVPVFCSRRCQGEFMKKAYAGKLPKTKK